MTLVLARTSSDEDSKLVCGNGTLGAMGATGAGGLGASIGTGGFGAAALGGIGLVAEAVDGLGGAGLGGLIKGFATAPIGATGTTCAPGALGLGSAPLETPGIIAVGSS